MNKLKQILKYGLIFISFFIINFVSSSILFTNLPILSIVLELIYIGILIFIFRKTLIKEWHIFTKNIDQNISIIIWYWIFGVSIMTISNVLIANYLPVVETNNEDAIRFLIKHLPLTMMFSVMISAPIIEEFIFRLNLRKIFKNKWVYLFISSIAFGSMHVIYSMSSIYDLLLIIPYGAMGFYLSLAYLKSNSIFTSFVMHIFHNTITFLLLIISI